MRKARQGDTVRVHFSARLKNGHKVGSTIGENPSDQQVTIDANHPLAGETLIFDVELIGFV